MVGAGTEVEQGRGLVVGSADVVDPRHHAERKSSRRRYMTAVATCDCAAPRREPLRIRGVVAVIYGHEAPGGGPAVGAGPRLFPFTLDECYTRTYSPRHRSLPAEANVRDLVRASVLGR
jgi:hypothetical protein